MKLFILFLVVLFGAYSEYQAKKTVKQLKADERKLRQGIDSLNTGSGVKHLYFIN